MARGLFTLKQQLQGVEQSAWNAPFGNTYGASFAGNGSGQYLLGPTTGALNFSTGNFTVEMWLYMNAYGGGGLTLVFSASNASADFQIGVGTSNNVYWHNSGIQITSASTAFALGRWAHIALVRSGSNCAIFANGVRVGTATNSAAVNLTNFNVGSYQASVAAYMLDGFVSNLRITNTAVYDPTATSYVLPTGPLTAITGTQLLTLQNATIVDNSTNALSITNNGSVATQIVNPFGLQLPAPAVDYLVVAGGGGGGGGNQGGGGGAGGLLQGSLPVTAGSSITVTVGGGGTGGAGSAAGSQGQNSVFSSISATGGGYGSAAGSTVGGNGGSGGGAIGASTPYVGGQSTFGQGNAGGDGSQGPNFSGSNGVTPGGGGGAGTVGYPGIGTSATVGASGGAGIASSISGTITTYAGGGGAGGDYRNAGSAGTGGVGGVGGGGGGSISAAGTAGTVNTGGGGGGGGYNGTFFAGGTGGSGIVILSYPDIYAGAAATTGSPTASTSGSGSLSFNGSTQTLQFPDNPAFSLGSANFTIECWLYRTSTGEVFFAGQSDSSGAPTNISFIFYINSSNCLALAAYSGGTGYGNSDSTAITNNQWVHVAAVRDGNTLRLYKNGVQVITGAVSGSLNDSTYRFGIGSAGEFPTKFYQGYISNFRMVVGTCLYPSGTTFTPSTTPLTAVTNTSLLLNSVSGAYLQDSSTNRFTPSTSSVAPTWNQLSPFATGLGYKNRVYTYTGSGTITF